MKGKKLISGIYFLLKYVLYLNIVLAGGVLGFQIINIFRPEKSLIASYLGNFVIELKATGILNTGNGKDVALYIESILGTASLGINSTFHWLFILVFTLMVVCVTLFYNYKFYKIFENLNNSVKQGSPFSDVISKDLKSISIFSILVFFIGSVLSICKLLLIESVVFNNFVAHPVYDNQLLNFLWFGLGIFLLNEIYKVGLDLKNEQELTV